MIDPIYKDFFTDHQTRRVLDSSEVFRAYATAELARDELRKKQAILDALEARNNELDELSNFRDFVDSNPVLKAKLKQAKAALEENPELIEKVDPGFVHGLSLLNLNDDDDGE